jgi:hypothetical protein
MGRPATPWAHWSAVVTSRITETIIKVINKQLGANTSLNPKVEFKIKV